MNSGNFNLDLSYFDMNERDRVVNCQYDSEDGSWAYSNALPSRGHLGWQTENSSTLDPMDWEPQRPLTQNGFASRGGNQRNCGQASFELPFASNSAQEIIETGAYKQDQHNIISDSHYPVENEDVEMGNIIGTTI